MPTTTSTTTSSYAILLIAAIAGVLSTGFVDARKFDAGNSCATVLCPAPSNCKRGKCTLICPVGFKNCNVRVDDGCEVNVKNGDVQNCGRCRAQCPPGKKYEFVNCVNGKCKYTDKCTAIKCATYPNSSTTCTKGQCRVTCDPGFDNCNGVLEVGKDGCEVDLNLDVDNCGYCGNVCRKPAYGTRVCRSGVCKYH